MAARAVAKADFAIIGAGIIGINIAAVLRTTFPRASILVVDKEGAAGLHASGRNSGVLHAGLYYSPGLKASFTAAGNRFLTDYIKRKGIPLRQCGKLVVARCEEDLPGLDLLFGRAAANGVEVHEVTEARALELEPLCRTHKRALWSPSTAVSDPAAVLAAQLQDAAAEGVRFLFGAPATRVESPSSAPGSCGVRHSRVHLADGSCVEAGHVMNAAGLYSDQLAHSAGFAHHLRILPFKGLYLYCQIPLQCLVYPVPQMGGAFLGTHFTLSLKGGGSKIGPTAIPALWREHYGAEEPIVGCLPPEHARASPEASADGSARASSSPPSPSPRLSDTPSPSSAPSLRTSWAQGFCLSELASILGTEAALFLSQPSFRSLAMEEVRKYDRAAMIRGAADLVPAAADASLFTYYGRAGIRAQLVDVSGSDSSAGGSSSNGSSTAVPPRGVSLPSRWRLVMDFQLAGDAYSTHVLNAVSPGWTSSRPFAEHVVRELQARAGGPG